MVSSMVFEAPPTIMAIVKNLVQFTQEGTPIVIHVSSGVHAFDVVEEQLGNARFSPRVYLNPRRLATAHGAGTILLGHVLNAEYAARGLGLEEIEYCAVMASASRFFLPGIERWVAAGQFSKVAPRVPWLEHYCEDGGRRASGGKDGGLHAWYFNASFFDKRDKCITGFSGHEGMFFPMHVFLAFIDWARRTRTEDNATIEQRLFEQRGAFGGFGFEEVYLQTFILANFRTDYDRHHAGGRISQHWPPRAGRVGALDVLAYRLARNTSQTPMPLAIKRWSGLPHDNAFVECLGRADESSMSLAPRANSNDDSPLLAYAPPLPVLQLQLNTLACLNETNFNLDQNLRGNIKSDQKQLTSILGSRDAFPSLRALYGQVREWVANQTRRSF